MSHGAYKIESGGFPLYDEKILPKVNAMRRALSLPASESVPIASKGDVLFTTAEEMNDEPSSCANCIFYNEGKSCSLIGERIKIRKFTYPREATADSKPVEYWPCCGMHYFGVPNTSAPTYKGTADPDYMGLIWINAAKPGQEHGGANCGGCNGGDDCDHYIVDGKEAKWDSPTGFCRVLQTNVACGDVCASWRDDDQLGWREAQKIIGGLNG
jgi:hypothetical protein